MSGNKRPRKAYRPRDVLVSPLPYRTSDAMGRNVALRVRTEIDAVVSHAGTQHHVRALSCELLSLQCLVIVARKQPSHCPITSESLDDIAGEVQRIGRSLGGVTQRMDATGAIGCSGTERADLLALADLHDKLLQVMPRRLWHDAYALACRNPELRIEEAA